jgi:hypothetical protein
MEHEVNTKNNKYEGKKKVEYKQLKCPKKGICSFRCSASVVDCTTLEDYPALLTEGRPGVLIMVPSFAVTGEIKFNRP